MSVVVVALHASERTRGNPATARHGAGRCYYRPYPSGSPRGRDHGDLDGRRRSGREPRDRRLDGRL